MGRVAFALTLAAALALCAWSAACAAEYLVNGDFSEELAGTWATGAAEMGNPLGWLFESPYYTVDIVGNVHQDQGGFRNPALRLYRWDGPGQLLIGAGQMLAYETNPASSLSELALEVDVTIIGQDWSNSVNHWYAAEVAVLYKPTDQAAETFVSKRFYANGTEAADPDGLIVYTGGQGQRYHLNWDLRNYFVTHGLGGAEVTGVALIGGGSYFETQFDNVAFRGTLVPEPAGFVALAVGLSGMIPVLARKRRESG